MFSIFPKDDNNQTLRIKRFLMGLGSYVMWSTLGVFLYFQEHTRVTFNVLVVCLSGSLATNILLYTIIRTGLNKRLKDPSLTLFQIVIATFWAMVVVYYADSFRSLVLLLYLVVFVFGLFRLTVWQFLFLSVFAVVNYAAIILLLYEIHPESINNKTDVLNLVILATVLLWFSLVGGYISSLRTKISKDRSTIEQLTDNIHDVIFVLDMNLNYTYVSPSVKILRGYEPGEVLKQAPFDAITPSSLDLGMRTLSEVMELEKIEHRKDISRTLQLEIRRKDGTTVWTETKFSFIRDKNQRPLHILGVMRDITERKQMEEALRQSEEKYRNILENIQEGYFEVDLAGNFTFFNDTVCRVTGYPKEELIGMNNRQYTDKEELKKVFEAYNKVYKTGEPNREFGWQITRKDGAKRYIEGSISLQKDSSGKPTGFRGISRDITERKRMEDKLRFEEQRFRAFVEHSSDMIVLVNLEGVITYVNPAIESVLGFKPEERIGAYGFEIVHPDDIKALVDVFNTLSKDTNYPVIKGELRLRHKDGSWRTLEAVGSNQINNNVVEYIIINYRDITERKRAEEALLESEQRYRDLSIIDDLTQLYNSRHFYAQLEREIERSNRYGQPLTLLLLDLDKFKNFNDKYGHVQGDYVLLLLGHVIKRSLREIDSAYRYGGEEFTIMLPMTSSEEGIVTAKRIQTELRKENFSLALGQEVYMTVSIGLAQYKPKEEMKAFVHRVDQLMYQAKKNGRDRICPES